MTTTNQDEYEAVDPAQPGDLPFDKVVVNLELTPQQLVDVTRLLGDGIKVAPLPRWIASLGEWSDSLEWNDATGRWRHDNGIVGPFYTKEEALAWVKEHSMSLGNVSDLTELGQPIPPDEEYEQYIHEFDPPEAWVSVQLGDLPGQFTPEGAAELLRDLNPDLRKDEPKDE